jgi:hypothetical protein
MARSRLMDNQGVAVLRFLSLAALAVWIGGLAALGGVAAPELFAWLQAHDPVAGRETAGQLFGVIFARFQHFSWALGGVAIVSLIVRAILGPRPRHFGIRAWLLAAMLAFSVATALWITPRIEAIRNSVSGPVASLADTDARKVTFGRLHGLSNVLMLMTIVTGLGLMWMEAGDRK